MHQRWFKMYDRRVFDNEWSIPRLLMEDSSLHNSQSLRWRSIAALPPAPGDGRRSVVHLPRASLLIHAHAWRLPTPSFLPDVHDAPPRGAATLVGRGKAGGKEWPISIMTPLAPCRCLLVWARWVAGGFSLHSSDPWILQLSHSTSWRLGAYLSRPPPVLVLQVG